MLKVSVIVPVYNPGASIDDCISSLLGQSLPAEEYEVIFVDDGSTDETPARLDELAAQHENVRVEHTPNSGWPGRPRNIGMDLARAEFVYFVDNDDWLGREALERLYANAVQNEADIVVGKVVGQGKVVPRTLFRRNRPDVTLEWPPLLRLLTPHKLFRKALLEQHGIRFPEGRRRLEDHLFVVHAFFHARRISILADYPCYHWVLRDSGANASWQRLDASYFDNVREVLDLVSEHTEPGPFRDRLYMHWYRGKMLGRVGGRAFVDREPQYRHELYEDIRRLADERYGPEVEELLPFNLQARSRLLREGTYESLGTLAEFEAGLRADVSVRELQIEGNELALQVDAELPGAQGELAFVRRGNRMMWLPPRELRQELGAELDATEALEKARVQIVLRSGRDRSEWVVPTRSELVLLRGTEEGARRALLVGAAELSSRNAAAGARLRPGLWHVMAIVDVVGFTSLGPVTTAVRTWDPRSWVGAGARRPLRFTVVKGGGILMRPPLRRRLARRLPPGARRLLRRARRRVRAARAPA